MKTIGCRIPADMADKLNMVCTATGASPSEIMLLLIQNHLNEAARALADVRKSALKKLDTLTR